jgi:hypothetical protein
MKDLLTKFGIDLFTGAVAGAIAVLSVTNLDTANPKVLAINGAINAARRYAVTKAA